MSTVFILGAGASRFAGFPLGVDLWRFLEKEEHSREIQAERNVQRFRTLVEKVSSFLGASPAAANSPDIELIFTILDLADMRRGVLGALNIPHGDLRLAKFGFARLIPSAFLWRAIIARQAIEDGSYLPNAEDSENPDPQLVQRVAAAWGKIVQPEDLLISFNWDPLHEMIFWREHRDDRRLWHYKDGYGFSTGHSSQEKSSQVKILKLHGSSNWGLRNPEDATPILDYTFHLFPNKDHFSGSSGESLLGYSLILPSYLKAPAEKPWLVPIWQQAADALQTADEIIVLGYSLPEADGPTRTLLSVALSGNEELAKSKHEKPIRVIAGSQQGFGTAYDRWDHFFATLNIRDKVQMVHNTFEQFVLEQVEISEQK